MMTALKQRRNIQSFYFLIRYTVEPGYKDIGLGDTAHIASDILPYHLIPANHNKEWYT